MSAVECRKQSLCQAQASRSPALGTLCSGPGAWSPCVRTNDVTHRDLHCVFIPPNFCRAFLSCSLPGSRRSCVGYMEVGAAPTLLGRVGDTGGGCAGGQRPSRLHLTATTALWWLGPKLHFLLVPVQLWHRSNSCFFTLFPYRAVQRCGV